MNGSYVIGSAPSDFTTLKEAIDSLNNPCGISGSVIFEIKPGTYNSQNSLSEIYGANALFDVTFRSQTGDSTDVIITSDSTDYTFRIFGADNIAFKNLTFTTDTTPATIVEIGNRSDDILFEACIFSGNTNSGTLFYSADNDSSIDNRLIINNNRFLNGGNAISIYPGYKGDEYEKGVVISNNYFDGQTSNGIYFYYYDSILIANNTFTSGKWAIYGSGKNVTISGNLMKNDVQGAFRLYGTDYLVKNNMSKAHGNTGSLTTATFSLENSKFYNNTFLKQGENACGVITNYGNNCDYKNNIIINFDEGTLLSLGGSGNTSDYNVYYTNGDEFASGYPGLSEWQIGTSQDLNSFFEVVNFINDTNFHTNSLIVDGSGTPVSEVTTDFDNEIRDAVNPDIGADEFSSSCTSSLAGTYTLGETGTYKSFTEAIDALNFCGIGGNVTFDIEDGTYNTQVLIDQEIPEQNSYKVLFRSASGDNTKVIIEYNADSTHNYVIKLDGTDNIIFEDITIKSLNSEYGRVIEIVNHADNNRFFNTIIEGAGTDSDLKELALIYINELQTANDSIVFDNNVINYGAYGVYIESDRYKNSCTFSNNIFTDQGAGAVHCYQAGYINLISNTIERSAHSNAYNGIYSDYSDSCAIIKNTISIVSGTVASGLTLLGKHTVINNFISINTSGTERNTGIFSSGNVWMFNNSVNITGTGSNTKAADLSYTGVSVIHNNIFANSAGGFAVFMYSWSNPGTLDYNCLYSNGEYLASKSSNFKTLAGWTASTSYDSNSVSLNPVFLSESDLHTSAVLLNGNAIPVALVTTDIDGETRDAVKPDIGADEFFTPSFQLGDDIVSCVDDEVKIDAGIGFDSYLWSTGSDSSSTVVDSTGIGYGEKEISVVVSLDEITYYDTIQVRFSSPIAAPVTDYCFNENADSILISAGEGVSYLWNNGATTQSIYITPGNWYNNVTVTDMNGCTDFGEIQAHPNYCMANLTMPKDTTITYIEPIILDANAGCSANYESYSYLWNTGDTTETITLDTLQYGLGTHTFSVTVINKASNFCESSDTVNITLEISTGVNDIDYNQHVVIFPNPSTGMFQVQGEDIERIEVYNLQGQILQSVKGNEINRIDLGQQSKGIYFVKVIQGDRYRIRKLVLE
ncbi:hypothetical protein ES708_09332 [subsurface metagenome]